MFVYSFVSFACCVHNTHAAYCQQKIPSTKKTGKLFTSRSELVRYIKPKVTENESKQQLYVTWVSAEAER